MRQIEELTRTGTNWNGMQRWVYIVIGPDKMVRPTPKGRQAREVWSSLFPVVEHRWRERFGTGEIDGLVKALRAVSDRLDDELPECLPILGYGLWSKAHAAQALVSRRSGPPSDRTPAETGRDEHGRSAAGNVFGGRNPARGSGIQPTGETRRDESRRCREESLRHVDALLSRVLLAFAIEFETASPLSLAISANVLRVLTAESIRQRDIPTLSGVSKESISVALGILTKQKLAVTASDGRTKIIRLTAKGLEFQTAYHRLVAAIEERWRTAFGADYIEALRQSFERFVGDTTPEGSPLFRGLTPYPEGWRAAVPAPRTLPHYPMVLHRGGYPDGS